MAVPARPGPSDDRVPCPVCGGLVHPIAGKCKHCKADLTSYHAARPAATAPLPALLAARSGHANGHPEYAPPAFAAVAPVAAAPDRSAGSPGALGRMVATAREAAQPVLPPRPSYPASPRRSAWRSWPVVVIMLAVFAIVAAIVLMVLPVSRGGPARDRKSALQPPPAPERMPTDPDVKQPRPRVAPQPTAPARPSPPVPEQSDPPAQAPDPDLDDGSRDPMPNSLSPNGQSAQRADPDPPLGAAMALPMAAHLCRKMAQCHTMTASSQTICDAMTDTVSPDHCPAAARCLAHIDALACSPPLRLQQMGLLLRKFQDCAEAMTC
jgi:hypothetical protein